MSIDRLPDELLREILSDVLHVSKEDFFAWPDIRKDLPREAVPRSHVVLVNRRFLRIGIPLLYEAVRSTDSETTKHIADILRANASVGPGVRWLRLEGGYGRELEWALKHTPALDALYFSLAVRRRDSIVGAGRALSVLDPAELWLAKATGRPNQHTAVLHQLLPHLLRRRWTRTRTVAFEADWGVLHEALVVALRDAPALEELALDEADAAHWLGLGIIQTIAENPRLARVVCRGSHFAQRNLALFFESLLVPARVVEMFVFVKRDKKRDRRREPERSQTS